MPPTPPAPWVALVGPEVEENLSLRYLAAALGAAGLRCELYAFNQEQDFPRIRAALSTARPAPLLVGLSLAFQWRARDFLALAMALREDGYAGHITAGGHFATFTSEDLLSGFPELDSICRFEAEATLVELVVALRAGRPLREVAGLALRDPESGAVQLTAPRAFPDLAALPHPDRRGEPALCFGHRIAPLVGSRGCYGNCSFCCIAAWHEKTLPGRRYRMRDVDDVAAEMVEQQRTRGVEIFVFQDDNFFLPTAAASLARIHALADALHRRGAGRFATVLKARPDDVHPEVFRALVERLNTIRVYVGIETDADQGLRTLRRGVSRADTHAALAVVRELGVYICFNLLCFDPDTTLAHLEQNIDFMESVSDFPFCIGRVELYAGTPILARMRAEGRARGDWLQWDYDLADEQIERVFAMTMASMRARNYGDRSPITQLWLLRFDIEAARFFHPECYRDAWLEEAVAITRRLSMDTVTTLRAIVARVRSDASPAGDAAFAQELGRRCQRVDAEILAAGAALALRMGRAVGQRASLTEVRTVLDTRSPPSLELT